MASNRFYPRLLFGVLPFALVVAAATTWSFLASGQASLSVAFFFACMIGASFATGDLIVRYVLGAAARFSGLSIRLLLGFLALNLCVYTAFLLVPLGLAALAGICAAVTTSIWGIVLLKKGWIASAESGAVECVYLLVSILAVTLWCQDLFRLVVIGETSVVVMGWQDIFFHLRQISSFAAAASVASMSDIQMAGAPAHAYHYASYVLPSSLSAATAVSSLHAYAGTFVPFGLLLTGLAGFCLLSSLMGRAAGAAAGLALLCAPDALQQGFGNSFLSYHWLQHIAPAALYGVATAAVAWLFMFEACHERRIKLVAVAFAVALSCVLFKAQIFVATSYLMFVFPALFMANIPASTRKKYFWGATAIFFVVASVAQFSKNVPVMRLDGTGISYYGAMLNSAQKPGLFQPFVDYTFTSATSLVFIVTTALALLFLTFGLWTLIYPLLVRRLNVTLSKAVVLFPLLVVLNYLLMSQGLATDSSGLGMPEELLHRPFVWAYFVVCTWTAAAVCYLVLGAPDSQAGVRTKMNTRLVCIASLVALPFALAVPALHGHKIHALPQWMPGGFGVKIPTCVVTAGEFVQARGDRHDLVQDSKNDPIFVLTALSERQSFVAGPGAGNIRTPDGLHRRIVLLNVKFKKLTSATEVVDFARRNGISWYLRAPSDEPSWPADVDKYVDFQCGGYRLYHFPRT